ncbi:MAG: UDP-N-acetylglucosamine 1-carboxyvinyltransferase 1 [Candidatus Anoxychlamydiales bacterium]|uniref:UDP-N-acetylglucosamine 1-carboxyvinyltransferase n=1 Tax=marine sediment metagenome TaxID=412755 RepID=A0A0F9IRK5_9ZZZZ|nr:UDP-N-acetylglucosamine 1-carboxyvinyltransferase 1 [Candidatus Anoxychlamydiales bacterium]NGX41533.1 UDP-N-acetylglucosamine 1-carboxyvinyltransferase 1 [Candidatus Anoxychlamydiales bacterium]HEU64931.1 UDP-N-acetylglucosamine 1-carboxyvinyltransferase [Chlamydiota bacterium]
MNLDSLKIKGGATLNGRIKAQGAKNAMTKLLVASLISDKKCIFHNVPNIGDVEITVALCREIGMDVLWDREKHIMEVQTKELKNLKISQRFSGANRIPILMIGALLGRTNQEIIVPTVGGDDLGSRPLDFHMASLKKLGAAVGYREDKEDASYFAKANLGLQGALITLAYPSVGATENTILAAIRAKGKTIIKNAAIEPEIVDLILFLQKLGANIFIDTDRTIHIEESNKFYEALHYVIPDRNEIISYALATIATKGRIFIEGAEHLHLITFLNKLREVRAGFNIKKDGIEFFYDKELKGNLHIETDVHPGFMTDWQQPFVVLLTQTKGSSVLHETVYENRFGYIKTLKEMGADIELFTKCLGSNKCRFNSLNHKHSLVVKGPSNLVTKDIKIPDLRAGFAYVMAALLADGKTTIEQKSFLDRGYENIVEKLQSLGANIEKNKNKSPKNLDILKKSLNKELV